MSQIERELERGVGIDRYGGGEGRDLDLTIKSVKMNIQPKIPDHMKEFNAKKGSQHNNSV